MNNAIGPQRVTDLDDEVDYFTAREVASQLGKSERTIWYLVSQRRLGSVKIGHQRRFTQAHVDAYRATYLAAVEVPAAPVGTRLAA